MRYNKFHMLHTVLRVGQHILLSVQTFATLLYIFGDMTYLFSSSILFKISQGNKGIQEVF